MGPYERHHHPASHWNRLQGVPRSAVTSNHRPSDGFTKRRAEDDITQPVPVFHQP
jgi:hypothetical protein